MNYRDTLEDIELRLDLGREFDAIERFYVGVCRSLELSAAAREALEVATQYLEHAVSDEDLERARVACWASIKGRDLDLCDREVASTRAVICAMYPRGWGDNAFCALDAFEEFATAAGVNPDDLVLALQTTLADALRRGVAQRADGAGRSRSTR